MLKEQKLILTITDEVEQLGERFYVKATATLYDESGKDIHHVIGMAREAENKKGMDESQITGAASSYARKYSLNGLFCIDDTKDADVTNKHEKEEQEKPEELKCKKCGKKITFGAYKNWNGLCAGCYRESKAKNE